MAASSAVSALSSTSCFSAAAEAAVPLLRVRPAPFPAANRASSGAALLATTFTWLMASACSSA
eukprot:CAMPEP_0171788946 /NCGR_PEP_ID=MMETSP0991-20121206/64800_1 /TAXON_ID=483369 /ORGANISM="non described non described, Strain CCMP2098" /LENGTH=62 /DNA_ID=CAMNT_0012398189 /DNA_START=150 /DNA_END=338 /DNA_ORIENTATION=+